MNALRIGVAGWCHDRDRRWSSYHAAAAHRPWPQGYVFSRPQEGVWALLSGGGGGSQQATFRDQLEPYVSAAWDRCRALAEAALEAALASFEREIQRSFVDVGGAPFSDQLSATWVCAMTDGQTCVIRSQHVERGWLYRDGELTQITADAEFREQLGGELPERLARRLVLNRFGMPVTAPNAFVGRTTTLELRRGDVIVLATATDPFASTPERMLTAVEQSLDPTDLEATARALFAAVDRDILPDDLDCREVFRRRGAALVLRAS
jgi:hypothetical protein